MDESTYARTSGIETSGLSVQLLRELKVASLRYFEAAGSFAAEAARILGGPLPKPLRAVRYPIAGSHAELILAWRSPTETLVMTLDGAAFAALEAGVARIASGGCMVDQSGGLWVWRLTGPRTRDVLLRVGSSAATPALGEAGSSRVAELPVMALCVHPDQIMLVAERVYCEHLLGWIGETAEDL